MDFNSFLTSLGTSFLIFFVLILIFSWLSRRPGNAVVYYPSRILKGMDPYPGGRSGSRNPFAWITEAAGAQEEEVVSMAGVDAAVYLIFLSTALGILVLSGIMLLPILLPVARTDDELANSLSDPKTGGNVTFNDLDKLAMANITAQSPRLWAFLFGTYWVTVITYIMLWKAYKHVSNLRAAARAREVRPEDYAVLVRDIPPVLKGQTRKEQVDAYFNGLYPEMFYRSMIITDIKEVNKIWTELESYRKKCAHAEAVFAESKSKKLEGTRPTCRTGFLGIIGSKVDTIDYCNKKINELLEKLESEQKVTLKEKQEGAALVFFNSSSAAVSASQIVHAQLIDTWTVLEAPEPRQLLWYNLPKKIYERQIRQFIVYSAVFLAVVFYMVPIVFISAFTTLDNLKKLMPFLKGVLGIAAVKSVLEAYLPQIVLILFLALLPMLLMFLSKAEGIPSESHSVRAASGKYFYFIVFNVFIGVTIIGTLFSSLKVVWDHPAEIVNMLGRNLPKNATFFLTFVALKFFVGYGLELSRIVPFILYHLKRKYLCKTEDELKQAWTPGDFGYAIRVPNDLLILTIVLCYSVIAPLIIPFGVLYFGLGWLVLRNQALKVYVPSYESNGRMWPHMHKRIVAALIIYQITMISYFGIKKFYYASLLTPLPIMSFLFGFVCHNRFYLAFVHTPLEVAQRQTKEIPDLEAIYKEYVPECLRPQKHDEDEKFDDVV